MVAQSVVSCSEKNISIDALVVQIVWGLVLNCAEVPGGVAQHEGAKVVGRASALSAGSVGGASATGEWAGERDSFGGVANLARFLGGGRI
eukprot:6491209-Amphidinium_carterae.2